jgi:hypothetical protein
MSRSIRAMSGKFNYPVFILRMLFEAVFLVLGIVALVLGPSHWSENHDLSGVIGITVAFAVLLFYINFKFLRAIWTERFGIRFETGSLIITDHLLLKRRVLRGDDIKGFSLSEYPLRGMKVKSILLYLSSGKKVEFPQFLFFNFKSLSPSLQESGITFLGEEPYIWKWVDSRYYKFDE